MPVTKLEELTPASQALFLALANDAPNWSGLPLLEVTKAERGNVTHLKKAGLIETWAEEGNTWCQFTEAGKALAASLGISLT